MTTSTLTNTSSKPHKTHVTNNSGNNEWYTPSIYIESVRKVLGTINLDPASCAEANSIVQAENYFTQETNGLDKEWKGKVFLNPPYASSLIKLFIKKLVEEHQSGNIQEAILLVNNATETQWAKVALSNCSSACFVEKRIKFLNKDLVPKNTPLQGQMFVYFGKNKERFSEVFSAYGLILQVNS